MILLSSYRRSYKVSAVFVCCHTDCRANEYPPHDVNNGKLRSSAWTDRCSLLDDVMLQPNATYDVEEGYHLPLLTPGSAQPSNHLSIVRPPYVLRPETFFQPPSRPVSFARGRPSTVPKVTDGNLGAFLPSIQLPHSHPHPFTSSAAYNAYARSLRPPAETPRQYTHLVSVPIAGYGSHHQDVFQQERELRYNSQAGPSRRGSENPAFRSNGNSHRVSSPSRIGTTSTSTLEKAKVRKKQGPSVKRTEVGMACQFCRRRSVESRSSLCNTYEGRADF
jgi:hypothetical protein